jgi:hypothetical protein
MLDILEQRYFTLGESRLHSQMGQTKDYKNGF